MRAIPCHQGTAWATWQVSGAWGSGRGQVAGCPGAKSTVATVRAPGASGRQGHNVGDVAVRGASPPTLRSGGEYHFWCYSMWMASFVNNDTNNTI